MNMYLVGNIILCLCAFVSSAYGGVVFFKPKKALYGKMIALAMICIVVGRLFNIVRLMTGGNLYENFQLGSLGIIGSILFFYTSNYGTLDSLVDDGSKKFIKYRIIGLIASAVTVCMYFPLFFMGDTDKLWKIQGGVLLFFIALSSYYHLKHLVMPDVDFGIVKSLRPFNFLALLYMCSSVAECFAMSRRYEILTLITCCLSGLCVLTMIILTVKGLNKAKE